jgi:hypothetical protein
MSRAGIAGKVSRPDPNTASNPHVLQRAIIEEGEWSAIARRMSVAQQILVDPDARPSLVRETTAKPYLVSYARSEFAPSGNIPFETPRLRGSSAMLSHSLSLAA